VRLSLSSRKRDCGYGKDAEAAPPRRLLLAIADEVIE